MPKPMVTQRVRFEIDWEENFRDDEDKEVSRGWYVHGEHVGGPHVPMGPSRYEDGCATVDDALALVAAWAEDNGFRYDRPIVTVTVTKRIEDG